MRSARSNSNSPQRRRARGALLDFFPEARHPARRSPPKRSPFDVGPQYDEGPRGRGGDSREACPNRLFAEGRRPSRRRKADEGQRSRSGDSQEPSPKKRLTEGRRSRRRRQTDNADRRFAEDRGSSRRQRADDVDRRRQQPGAADGYADDPGSSCRQQTDDADRRSAEDRSSSRRQQADAGDRRSAEDGGPSRSQQADDADQRFAEDRGSSRRQQADFGDRPSSAADRESDRHQQAGGADRRFSEDDKRPAEESGAIRKKRRKESESDSNSSDSRTRRQKKLKKPQSTVLKGGFDQKEMPKCYITPVEYASSEMGQIAAANARDQWRIAGQAFVEGHGSTHFSAKSPGFGMLTASGLPNRAGGCGRFLAGKCFDAACPRYHPKNEAELRDCLIFFAERYPERYAAEMAGNWYCKFGAMCKTPDCIFKHPDIPTVPQGLGPCRWGVSCRTPNCPFTHPDKGEGAIQVTAPEPKAPTYEKSALPKVVGMPRLTMPSRI